MLLVVCTELETPLICAGAVDDSIATLRSLSPAELNAVTWYEYSTPPDKPLTAHDVVTSRRPLQATTSTLVPTPEFRYTTYPVTADPEPIAGAFHNNTVPVVVCDTLTRPLGAGAHVDTSNAALRSLSPDELTAPTKYVYFVPPARLFSSVVRSVSAAESVRPSYTSVSVIMSSRSGLNT
jgi:hypothetical protein|tara:strand:- start:228 stop:767 length:540 start_codon:yes stop_codon:yes gene_type:complete